MSNINKYTRSSRSRLRWDEEELRTIKVVITRLNVSEPYSTGPLIRTLDDPASLIIHIKPDEGLRPVFDNILVNQYPGEAVGPSRSRSNSLSNKSIEDQGGPKPRNQSSPPPSTSRDHREDCYSFRNRRRDSQSRKLVYQSSSARRSKSPNGFPRDRSPRRYKKTLSRSPDRRRSKSSYSKTDRGRSPPKYDDQRRRRSKSPPPRRSSRGPRSYSPYHRRSRSSRSPYRRSKYSRSPRRSPSPRGRYSSERHHEDMPYEHSSSNPYYKGAQFWIPNPMLPRFIPNRMIPPVGFPYAFAPGIPPMAPPPMPFRPRIMYNNRTLRGNAPTSTTVAAIEKSPETKTVSSTESKNIEVSKST